MDHPDHVVIGSGINRLVAASLLALKGRRVLVLERESVAGGCMRTEELISGFAHDPMAATFVLFMTGPAGVTLGHHLARHGFDYSHTPHPTAVLRPDGSALVLTTDGAENRARLNALSPSDGDAHARVVAEIGADAPFLFSLLGNPVWGWPMARLLFAQARKRALRGLAAWFGQALGPARGNFQLHHGRDRLPEWLSPGLEQVALIHLADGIDGVSRSVNEAERGLLPAVPTIRVGQPRRVDPSRCPEGKAVLWLQVPDAPRGIKGDAAGQIAGTERDDLRESLVDRLKAILCRHIRDFRPSLLAGKALSPKDLERMNINLVGGDPDGGACQLDQFFLWRPFSHSTNGTGQIKGLIHIGASTHPGPGLGVGSGFNAARGLGA